MNILNKQSRIADKGWFSSLGFGRSANDYSRTELTMLRAADKVLNLDWSYHKTPTMAK